MCYKQALASVLQLRVRLPLSLTLSTLRVQQLFAVLSHAARAGQFGPMLGTSSLVV